MSKAIGAKPKKEGSLPTGVTYVERIDKYMAKCSTVVEGKSVRKTLGYFDTPEEAYAAYIKYKQAYLDQMKIDVDIKKLLAYTPS